MGNYLVTLIGHSGKTTLPWRVRARSLEHAHTEALANYAKANGKDAQGVHSVVEPNVSAAVHDTPGHKSVKGKGAKGKGKKK
jgi:hypothetical protein